MRLPWVVRNRHEEERAAEQRVSAARSHLRIVINELERTVSRLEDKLRGLANE